MRFFKTLPALALAIASSHVFADWVEIGSGVTKDARSDSSVTIYYDHARTKSINRTGSLKMVFTLQSFGKNQTIDGVTSASYIGRMEVDCQNQKFQPVAFFFYSEPMANGNIVKSVSEPSYANKWEYPAPNSVMEEVISQACKR